MGPRLALPPSENENREVVGSSNAMPGSSANLLASLRDSLAESTYIDGLTHGFYHYPARFSPVVARAAIQLFSRKNDWVLDPFMGGGTAIVEGLALGRRMIGVDINPLAHFVASVRTTPLSPSDEEAVRQWVKSAAYILAGPFVDMVEPMGVHNMPEPLDRFMSAAITLLGKLSRDRQRSFVRCVLLRLGQWALDCREWRTPRRARLAEQLAELATRMLGGLGELVESSRKAGVAKNRLTSRRLLLNRSAVGLDTVDAIETSGRRPRLVITSPPYPGVHVLYHRWQYRGRKETPAPYRIAAVQDGHPESYYTAGSRTPTGLDNYFSTIEQAFSCVHGVLSSGAIVVQVVGFSDPGGQVSRYARAMERAGFEPWRLSSGQAVRLSRKVHNRKWYHRIRSERAGGSELLMIHRRT